VHEWRKGGEREGEGGVVKEDELKGKGREGERGRRRGGTDMAT
jgi:hypothetical protein